jgi:hypothetical protein
MKATAESVAFRAALSLFSDAFAPAQAKGVLANGK